MKNLYWFDLYLLFDSNSAISGEVEYIILSFSLVIDNGLILVLNVFIRKKICATMENK